MNLATPNDPGSLLEYIVATMGTKVAVGTYCYATVGTEATAGTLLQQQERRTLLGCIVATM
jgi:hypothetical protein